MEKVLNFIYCFKFKFFILFFQISDHDRKITIYKILLNKKLESVSKFKVVESTKQLSFNLLKMFPISPQEERLLAEGNNYNRNERKISKYRINVSPLSQTSRMGVPPHSVNRGCVKQREALPIFQFKEQILEMIDQNNVLLVVGHTGSGKMNFSGFSNFPGSNFN